MPEGLQLLDEIDEDRGLGIQGQRLLDYCDGLREVAIQEMNLAFPRVHPGIDGAVGAGQDKSVLPSKDESPGDNTLGFADSRTRYGT